MNEDSPDACDRCGGYGFTVHVRKGTKQPYPCPACRTKGSVTAIDAAQALAAYGNDLQTTWVQ